MDGLTERQLLLFGTIVQWFAQYEELMLNVSAAITGSDCHSIALLTHGLDFERKRLAFLDLLRHRAIPLDQYDSVCSFLRIPHGLTRLRDDICHCTWEVIRTSPGAQPDWLRKLPTRINPSRAYRHANSAHFFQTEHEAVGYAVDDLAEVVTNLSANYERFLKYLHRVSLIRPLAAQ